MSTKKLTIEFPETAVIPEGIEQEQGLLRNIIAVSLYKKGRLTIVEACKITGLSRHELATMDEAKMPVEETSVSENMPKQQTITKGESRWARVARRMSEENFLDGKSEEVLGLTRGFRENFTFRKLPISKDSSQRDE